MNPDHLARIVERARVRWNQGDELEALFQGVRELAETHAAATFLANEKAFASAGRAQRRGLRKRLATDGGNEFARLVVEEVTTNMADLLFEAEIDKAARIGCRLFRAELNRLFSSCRPAWRT